MPDGVQDLFKKHILGICHALGTVCGCYCCSVSQSCPTLCDPKDCSTPGFPVLPYLMEFGQTHVHWISDAIQPSHPLSSPSPPAVNISQHQGLFQRVSSWHQVAKVLELQQQSFQWIFRTLNEYPVNIQGTLKSLLQDHNLKALILQCSAFFMVQLSYPYMTTGKTIPWIVAGWISHKLKIWELWDRVASQRNCGFLVSRRM